MTKAIDKFSILIVDDKPTNIDLLRQYLSHSNFRISAVTSGEQALIVLAKIDIDLILLDVMMPGLDGYQTCIAIKESKLTCHIPVIFVTAKTTPSELNRGFMVGASDYITKPVHQDILLARINNQLSHIKREKLESTLKDNAKLIELGSMVASITHEVATPLSNLMLSIDFMAQQVEKIKLKIENKILKQSDFDHFIASTNEAISLSQSNAKRASQLMTSFKQVAVDQCSNNCLKFDLKTYIGDILRTIGPRLLNNKHNVIVHIDENLEINSYGGALSQIVINIVNNALMHGLSDVESGEITITASKKQDMVQINIEDNGVGMNEDELLHAFDKFFTTKAGKGGSGLGLGISRDLAQELLQGDLSIFSEIGTGTTVVLLMKKCVVNEPPT